MNSKQIAAVKKKIMAEAKKMAGSDRVTRTDIELAKRKLMRKSKKSEGGILDRFKTFLASGEKPKGQVGRGSADTLTGKIVTRKSVKEKEADKKKKMFSKTTPANKDTTKRSYQDAAGKGSGAGVNTVTATSFGAAFKIARKQLGAGKTFTYKGKKYTTDLASETKKGTRGPVQGPPKGKNVRPGRKTTGDRSPRAQAKQKEKPKTNKNVGAFNRRNIRNRNRGVFKTITEQQSGIPDIQPFGKGGMGNLKPVPAGKKGKGLRKLPKPVRNKMGYMSGGGVANGYGRAAMRPGKDPRTVSKT
tara:strand:+ start:985 stop:1890 length:906 start_codon:yes stop_codon:yes gene_type:complete